MWVIISFSPVLKKFRPESAGMSVTAAPVRFYLEVAQMLFDKIIAYVISFILIVPAIYIVNWIFYAMIIEISWVTENPPEFLQILSVFLDIIYDPLPLHCREDEDPGVAFWLAPFSPWLSTMIVFMIWALPDTILKISPHAFHQDVSEED